MGGSAALRPPAFRITRVWGFQLFAGMASVAFRYYCFHEHYQLSASYDYNYGGYDYRNH